ncbi:MAG: response regulator [Bacteroidales bacterium]|jgi:CheY-like chemotaxis protein|nr:response regulator [Bacteroidales bacterium]MDD4384462.1 response regulator [Bacteroidales bacterium]MDY0196815.1 response regulator [Tenuifilaceae bacterium]
MILIVDDSTTNQVLLEAILQEEGYETVTAFGAKEALKLVEKNKPRLILLDLLMPDISGFDFLKELKGDINTSYIPVIVVSAVGSRENIEMCMQYGAADFFSKPIDIGLFVSKVKQTMLGEI